MGVSVAVIDNIISPRLFDLGFNQNALPHVVNYAVNVMLFDS